MLRGTSLNLKLVLVVAILVAAAVTISFLGIHRMTRLNAQINDLVNVSSHRTLVAAGIQQDLLDIHRNEKNLILAQDSVDADNYRGDMQALADTIKQKIQSLEKDASADDKILIDRFGVAYAGFLKVNRRVQSAKDTDRKALDLSNSTGQSEFEAAQTALTKVATSNHAQAMAWKTAAESRCDRVLRTARIKQDLLSIQGVEKEFRLSTTPAAAKESSKAYDDTAESVRTSLAKLQDPNFTDESQQIAIIEEAIKEFLDDVRRIQLARPQPPEPNAGEVPITTDPDLGSLATKTRESFEKAERLLEKLIALEDNAARSAFEEAGVAARRAHEAALCLPDLIMLRRNEREFILAEDTTKVASYRESVARNDKDLRERIEAIKASTDTSDSPKESDPFEDYSAKYDAWRSTSKRALELKEANSNISATEISAVEGDVAYNEADNVMKQIATMNQKRMAADQVAAQEEFDESRTFMLVVSIVGILLASLVGFVVLKNLNSTLGSTISGLTEGAWQVSSAADQLSASSRQISGGASEQAASLEQTSASLEQMASMTKLNAENTGNANSMVKETSDAAGKGQDAMGRMAEAISEIQTSSKQTANIVKTIDEIAFQTNLLALNAAVEAARAGEAGKGFAVVAVEVRNLAQRSAEAAKTTAALIESSQRNAERGVKASDQVADLLDQIVTGVGKVSELMAEVSAASREQSEGIAQVNTAVAQMDRVTQRNASNAEQAAAASNQLAALSRSLNGAVHTLVALVEGEKPSGQPRSSDSDAFPVSGVAVAAALPPRLAGSSREPRVVRPEQIIPLPDDQIGDF